ncbi:hypothetical protein BDV95DRAFT_625270 [Massariosphaeria phaeospora]|uniref:N-acetyltransferase domain-containing protein n=1 Tax=Massariosphaeria phaeospora TaxID=100035 RepID=A0A7C8IHJ6_9PLEO|nr:hypothetical protein BDV95DRAFT_625270 [Massariosphaeria phaeospora]
MPRDLESEKATLAGMPPLSKEQASSPPPADPQSIYKIPTAERFKKMKGIHPYGLLLSQADLDDCDWLEHAAFEPHEAASREKLEYRLRTCGQLCSGIFSSAYPTTSGPLATLVKSRTFPSVDSADSDRKRLLLGHIIATRFTSPVVTDASMDFPKDWRTKYQLNPPVGHDEDGDTVCLHSLCVHPNVQGKGLAMVLLRGWIQRIKDSGTGKRIALLCREKLVRFYERAGFKRVGDSTCTFGGGGWIDMVLDFSSGVTIDDDI